MPSEVALRVVRDGARVLKFQAAVIGAGTSQRGSTPRWSELVVYKLANGNYLVSKVARSTVAHRPNCKRVRRWMVRWGSAQGTDEGRVNRSPCVDCWPDLQPPLDPELRLEVTHYQAVPVSNAESAVRAMDNPKARAALSAPQIVRDVLTQCAQVDEAFARYTDADGAPKPLEKTTRTG
jgi:hypothetical protein